MWASPSHLAASSGCVGGEINYGEGSVASLMHVNDLLDVSISLAPW